MTHCPVCGSPLPPDAPLCPTCGSPLETSSPALKVGTQLARGRYSVGRALGQGGFGITYQGADSLLRRRVALKELFPEGSNRRGLEVYGPSGLDFAQTRAEFLEEARTVAQFTHPGIVRVWDVFEENRTAYLVMELLSGMDLGKRLESGPLTLSEADDLILELSDALRAVHAAGLLHRDLKPDNVFLNKDGRTVLIDFGSARAFAQGQVSTHTRLVTPGYAPPEQYTSSAKFGPYTDLYAFGATLWHALSGVQPPPSTDRMMGAPLPAMPDTVPAILTRALEKALELRIDARPQSVDGFLNLLRGAKRETPARAPSPAPVAQTPTSPVPTPQSPVPTPRPKGIGGSRELARFQGKVFAVRFSPGGGTLAVSACGGALLGLCTRGQVSLWTLRTFERVRTLEAHSSAAYALDFSPDGDLVATGGEDGRVRLFSAQSGEVLQELNPRNPVTALHFRSSGFHLAFGLQKGEVVEWDLRAAQANALLELPGRAVSAVAYRPDGAWLALGSTARQGSDEPFAQLLELGGDSLEGFALEDNPQVRALAYSPDGRLLALGDEAGRIHLWDSAARRRLSTLTGHEAAVRSLSFGAGGRFLASGSDDHTVMLWDALQGAALERFAGHDAEVTSVSYRPEGGVVASGGFDQRVILWDTLALEG